MVTDAEHLSNLSNQISKKHVVCLPRLSVCAQTLGAAVAPPAGGAGVVRREPTDAAEVACR